MPVPGSSLVTSRPVHRPAATVHGNIESDFDLPVRKIGFGTGQSLKTTIAQGGAEVSLHTVNGGIRLQKR